MGSRPAPQASKKGRRVAERLKIPGAGVEDFLPLVSPISSRPLAREKEEEEEEMANIVHNFDARKHKRGSSFKRVTDATLEVAGEVSQQPSNNSFDVQAIVVSDLPNIGFHGQKLPNICILLSHNINSGLSVGLCLHPWGTTSASTITTSTYGCAGPFAWETSP